MSDPRDTTAVMGPPNPNELRWIEAVESYYNGMHAKGVCRRYGINRHTLARWCDRVDFRSTWADPLRQPPVPYPAPDYAPEFTAHAPAPSG